MLKNISIFLFCSPLLASFFENHNPKNLFYTKITIKRKEISKLLAQACLFTCIQAPASCWIVLDTCQMFQMKLWNVRTALNIAKQGDKAQWKSVPFTLSNANRITRKNKVMFYLVSLFLVAFVWFPWKVLPWYFFRNSTVIWDNYRQSLYPREGTMFSSLTGCSLVPG